MYINKAMVYGNLTRDPEMKALPSGQKVTSFSLATNRTWKDANGAKQEAVDYHNIVLFAKTAELAVQYLKKGSAVFIEGRIQTRSWDDAMGKKYRTEIVGENMQFGAKTQTQSEVEDKPIPSQECQDCAKLGNMCESCDAENIPF